MDDLAVWSISAAILSYQVVPGCGNTNGCFSLHKIVSGEMFSLAAVKSSFEPHQRYPTRHKQLLSSARGLSRFQTATQTARALEKAISWKARYMYTTNLISQVTQLASILVFCWEGKPWNIHLICMYMHGRSVYVAFQYRKLPDLARRDNRKDMHLPLGRFPAPVRI